MNYDDKLRNNELFRLNKVKKQNTSMKLNYKGIIYDHSVTNTSYVLCVCVSDTKGEGIKLKILNVVYLREQLSDWLVV